MPLGPGVGDIDNLDYGIDLTDVSQAAGHIGYSGVGGSYGYWEPHTSGGGMNPNVETFAHLGDVPDIASLFAQYGEVGERAAGLLTPYHELNENISKRSLKRDISDALSDIDIIALTTMKNKSVADQSIGKVGFVGSGAADAAIEDIMADHQQSTQSKRSGIRSSILGHRLDVHKERRKYVDELWLAYSDFLATDPDPTISAPSLGTPY